MSQTTLWQCIGGLFALAQRKMFTAVVGDIDAVCVVPRAMEREVFTKALEKACGEKLVKKAIEGGMRARAAFDKYGIM